MDGKTSPNVSSHDTISQCEVKVYTYAVSVSHDMSLYLSVYLYLSMDGGVHFFMNIPAIILIKK